ADISPGAASSSPGSFVATPDYLYFAATDPTNGRELWRIDRATSTPTRLTTLEPKVQQVRASAAGGVIFTTEFNQVYRFNGASTALLTPASFAAAPTLFGSANGFDYFAAQTNGAGRELWMTNGT